MAIHPPAFALAPLKLSLTWGTPVRMAVMIDQLIHKNNCQLDRRCERGDGFLDVNSLPAIDDNMLPPVDVNRLPVRSQDKPGLRS